VADFLMPILGADMVAGTLIAWRKQTGDRVTRGEIIAEVETEKGLIDVEVFVSGVIERVVIEPGTKVPAGTVLAIIREDVSTPVATPSRAPAPAVGAPAPELTPAPALLPPVAAPGRRVRVSPLARKLAAQLGIDPGVLQGTGPGGAVTREDVERAATASRKGEAPTVARARGRVDLARMRQTIAAAMARAKREIPHYYLAHPIDLHRALAWLTEANARRSVPDRLLYGVLLIKAVALALREVPELNAVWHGECVERRDAVNVGIAISLRRGGLVAPALHDTDKRAIGELMPAFRDLVQRARTGGLRSSELSDPTITVTSLGEQGIETVFGIVYPPQVAIVGFGKVMERPCVVNGTVVPRPLVTATLSADHRVSDGHRGGLFLAAVERLLQAPERL
jgi:pyruvate dehydrogenase E2 component (dihydrolipoamide acetyltransferase)